MILKQITAPAAEPLTTDDVKTNLRIDHTAEDTRLAALIRVAREAAETITRRVLIAQTWELVLDDWPAADWLEVPLPPLQSITSIKYKNEDGVESTLSASTYIVDADSEPGRVHLEDGETWPADTLYPVAAIRVRFVAGYGTDGSDVPESILQAMHLIIGHYYENREAVYASVGGNVQMLPMGVSSLLANYRVYGW